MKTTAITFGLILISHASFAASGIGKGAGLVDSGLKQYECTAQVQQIDPKSGKMGDTGSIYSIVLATDENSAKAVALNKLNLYGPVEGALFYMAADGRQFKVQSIFCH